MMVIDYAAKSGYSLPIRFAALTHDLGKGTTLKDMWPRHSGHEVRSVTLLQDVSKRLRVPNECKELAQIVAKFHGKVHQVSQMRADTALQFLIDTDAIRQPQRFKDFLLACECDSRGRTGFESAECLEAKVLTGLLEAVLRVDAGEVAKLHTAPEAIKQAVFDARLSAVKQVF
jgi:tRNA nucleotidyltransferase (CCA-adding enzyme)